MAAIGRKQTYQNVRFRPKADIEPGTTDHEEARRSISRAGRQTPSSCLPTTQCPTSCNAARDPRYYCAMAPRTHPTAVISTNANLAADVVVGPYAVIEDLVEIGEGTTIGPHAVIHSFVRMGKQNRIHGHAIIGDQPQLVDFDGSETWVNIGDGNVFREGVTIHRSIYPGKSTRVGSNCYFMTYSHVGHDCIVGDGVMLTNNVMLGGHVTVGERAIFGGNAGAHQFVRVGPYCMVAAYVPLRKDALPYSMIGGSPIRHYRLNVVGLRRSGVQGKRYRALEQAFRTLRSGSQDLSELPETEETKFLQNWLHEESKRGIYGFASSM